MQMRYWYQFRISRYGLVLLIVALQLEFN